MSKHLLLILCFFYIAIFSVHFFLIGESVYGDGAYYYSWLHSLAVDKSLNLENEFDHFNINFARTQTGYAYTKYPIGTALFWLPAYLWLYNIIGLTGYEPVYQFAVGLSNVIFVLIGLYCIHRTLINFYPHRAATAAMVVTALCTNLLYYGAIDTVNSHPLSFMLSSLFLFIWLTADKEFLPLGFIAGLISITRLQDIILVPAILPFLKINNYGRFLLGFMFAFGIQVIIWLATGTPGSLPYLSGGEYFDFRSLHIAEVLFAPDYGLFYVTPVTIFGIIGLLIIKDTSLKKLSLVSIFTGILIIVSAWSVYWQGATFGGRMFISILPVMAIGFAEIWQRFNQRPINIVISKTLLLGLYFLNIIRIYAFLIR